jgi:hypothetical protein
LAASADETEGECGLRLPDGGVTFPLTTDGHVLGVLTVWQGRGSAAGRGGGAPRLTRAQCACVSAVARSLALSTMLDQRLVWSGLSTDARTEQVLLQQVGHSLRSSVHQLGSPLAALRLFSKLILRRLPADDSETRQLVREMVSQAARMQDLIGPLQALAAQLPPPRPTAAMGGVGDVGADQSAGSGAQLLPEMPRYARAPRATHARTPRAHAITSPPPPPDPLARSQGAAAARAEAVALAAGRARTVRALVRAARRRRGHALRGAARRGPARGARVRHRAARVDLQPPR